jgi:hypothetical protein
MCTSSDALFHNDELLARVFVGEMRGLADVEGGDVRFEFLERRGGQVYDIAAKARGGGLYDQLVPDKNFGAEFGGGGGRSGLGHGGEDDDGRREQEGGEEEGSYFHRGTQEDGAGGNSMRSRRLATS